MVTPVSRILYRWVARAAMQDGPAFCVAVSRTVAGGLFRELGEYERFTDLDSEMVISSAGWVIAPSYRWPAVSNEPRGCRSASFVLSLVPLEYSMSSKFPPVTTEQIFATPQKSSHNLKRMKPLFD